MGRRKNNNIDWIGLFIHDSKLLITIYQYLQKNNLITEAVDVLRFIRQQDPNHIQTSEILNNIENYYGGKLSDSSFTFDNQEYKNILETIYAK